MNSLLVEVAIVMLIVLQCIGVIGSAWFLIEKIRGFFK